MAMIATPVLITALVVVAVAALGMSYTVCSEWIDTVVRKSWAYADAVPLLPGLGTGLSPLWQWLTVPAVILWTAPQFGTTPGSSRTEAE